MSELLESRDERVEKAIKDAGIPFVEASDLEEWLSRMPPKPSGGKGSGMSEIPEGLIDVMLNFDGRHTGEERQEAANATIWEFATLRSENERLRGALEYVDKAINNASIFPAKQGLFAEIQDVIRSALKGGDVCKTLDAQGSDCAQKRGDE